MTDVNRAGHLLYFLAGALRRFDPVRELTRFVGSTVGDEDFYVYSVRP